MSGICGLLRLDGQQADGDQVRAMLDTMAYRGPDGLNHLCSGPIVLGQATMHTTAHSLGLQLPCQLPGTGLQLVLDGRLDNRSELASLLRLKVDDTRPPVDAELVAAAYRQWGDDFPKYLDGDFALALWDTSRRRLFCARDHTGTRPFYYYRAPFFFAFATELPPLLALAQSSLRPNHAMVAQFLGQTWLNNADSFWEDFHRLPPAHILILENSDIRLQRYWQPDFQHVLEYRQEGDYRQHYRSLLGEVLCQQTRSNYPVAHEVSGGLDSSALFAVAIDLQRRGEFAAPGLVAYTLDFRGCGDADEVAYALAVGEHCGAPVEMVSPTSKPLAWYRARGAARGEFCGAPNGTMSLGLFSRAAEAGSRVLVNGTGGDEWLDAGTAAYAESLSSGRLASLPGLLSSQALLDGWPHAVRCAMRSVLGSLLPGGLESRLQAVLSSRELSDHLSPVLRRQLQQQCRESVDARDLRARWQRGLWRRLNDSYALLAHETMEVLAAEAGLELRRPFWSRRMIEFSISLPRRVLSLPGENRSLHRDALSGLLPAAILARDDKAEFSSSFRGLTAEVAQLLGGGGLPVEERWFRPGAYQDLLREGRDTVPGDANWPLWFLFCSVAALEFET